ncbi:SHOCT domain-containing protein [Glutamicibacter sp. 2E12]|uniref:SHOCT domain-containing protein n=1 Tax=Glutamicibacter sp. 2E12 TaxID=3416181 RepID=UPI003CF17DE0
MDEIEYSENIPGQLQEDLDSFGYIEPDPGSASSLFDNVDTVFSVGIPLFAMLFIAVIGLIIFVAVRNYRKAKSAGFDPLTLETELMARAANSAMLTPEKSLEDKLAELDSLHSRGIITRDEYLQARRDALSD